MHFTKVVLAVVLPYMAAANTHVGCKCNTGDDACLQAACNEYSDAGVFFNKPKGHEDTVFSQVKDGVRLSDLLFTYMCLDFRLRD
ncbi:hypothetical protein COL5a_006236 [Colletotrichum fioriniae]|uniref:uncharacterized protein n=1 Tax=Colletotrichum fioriniae TaxID=710243 RepID=UPI0032DAA074|nr:hypothetical protein COL5a_006236 [Colletotrichum fioriniae]KAJ3938554.1 hypothetical protein N0V96_011282 [Colletotrichum fioriniae]